MHEFSVGSPACSVTSLRPPSRSASCWVRCNANALGGDVPRPDLPVRGQRLPRSGLHPRRRLRAAARRPAVVDAVRRRRRRRRPVPTSSGAGSAWDAQGQRFWACDRGKVVGAIEGSGAAYAFTPHFSTNCKNGLAYDGVDGSLWVARGRTLTEYTQDRGTPADAVHRSARRDGDRADRRPRRRVRGDGSARCRSWPSRVAGRSLGARHAEPRVRDLECNGSLLAITDSFVAFATPTGGRDCSIGGAGDERPTTTSLTSPRRTTASRPFRSARRHGHRPGRLDLSAGFMWYDGSHEDGTYERRPARVLRRRRVATIAAWVIDDAGLPSQAFLQRTVVVHAAAACDPGAPLLGRGRSPGSGLRHQPEQPGLRGRQGLEPDRAPPCRVLDPAGPDPAAAPPTSPIRSPRDACQASAWPGIDILMPKTTRRRPCGWVAGPAGSAGHVPVPGGARHGGGQIVVARRSWSGRQPARSPGFGGRKAARPCPGAHAIPSPHAGRSASSRREHRRAPGGRPSSEFACLGRSGAERSASGW